MIAPGDDRCGGLAFLNFDGMSRQWLAHCLEHYGFGGGCRRWVSVLLAGTHAQVLYNGTRTHAFLVPFNVALGNPLSPLLYNMCCQGGKGAQLCPRISMWTT